MYGCLFALNAASTTFWCSHYIHGDDDLGKACRLHSLKATHDFMAAYHLLRASLLSQAANAMRIGCETAWHNAWLHEGPDRVDRWRCGKMPRPREVRESLTLYQSQRRSLYADLSQMAHPNERSMDDLAPPVAGTTEISVNVLLPVYSAPEIRSALLRLFYSLLICQLDFDRYHLADLTEKQKEGYVNQTNAMVRFYKEIIDPRLPAELRLELSA